jgi:hypothetical protein
MRSQTWSYKRSRPGFLGKTLLVTAISERFTLAPGGLAHARGCARGSSKDRSAQQEQ